MINIKEHIRMHNPDVQGVLDGCEQTLWLYMDKGKTLARSISMRAEDLLNEIKKHRNTQPLKQVQPDDTHIEFLEYLTSPGKLEEIVKLKPEMMEKEISTIRGIIGDEYFYSLDDDKRKSTEFGKRLIDEVFKYGNYRNSKTFTEIYKCLFFKKATCVYCNSTPAIIFKNKKGRDQALFELDHFYSEVCYPYLSMSFYNHIPSCSNCNARIKLAQEFTLSSHLHPFLNCFDEEYTFKTTQNILGGEALTTIHLEKTTSTQEKLAVDLELENRYLNYLTTASAPEFSEGVYVNRHLLSSRHTGQDEQKRFFKMLEPKAPREKNNILQKSYAKLNRDILKVFDVDKNYLKS
ncbi:hypothetical protein [Pantoea sp. A4]|uniref:hypothetical protein n=1 Tax=Pantoea sp. A4 TaxID=1225184 RepID=UPI00037CD26D|nr:hypothetical protein [Pantoea sp. A4]